MNTLFAHLIFYIREYLFPSGCGMCGTVLLDRKEAYYGLCGECKALLVTFLEDLRRCDICGKPLISEIDACLSCRKTEESINNRIYSERILKMRSLFPYKGKFKNLLGSYKFRNSVGVGNFLAHCAELGVNGLITESVKDMALVPVPPRPGKIKKQGWDQIHYLAGLLKKSGSYPVRYCLKRLPSKTQKELSREERNSNLKGRIVCVCQPPKTAVIFDDVITTGATLNACAEALLKAGTEKVYGLCLFYD